MRPENKPHHVILSMLVTGGFLSGARFDFVDGLNCFIGGRGAGKTTALEFLRFGLGLMPDPRAAQQRHRAIEALVKANLGNGRVNINIRTKTNMTYTAGRGANEAVQVQNESGTAVPISLDRDQIFSADVFSQNEIEEIASNPSAQLELLDRFREKDSAAIAKELAQLQRDLKQSGEDLLRLDEEIDDLRGRASEVVAIEEKLKGLSEVGGLDAERINAAHAGKAARTKELKIIDSVMAAAQRALREIASANAGFKATTDAQSRGSVLGTLNQNVLGEVNRSTEGFGEVLDRAVVTVSEAFRTLESNVSSYRGILSERHAVQELDFSKIMSESEEQGERSAERVALQHSLVDAQAAATEQMGKEAQRRDLAHIRADLMARTSELRDQRFAIRKRVAEQLTQKFASIRVSISQAAGLQEYRELLAEALKGAGFKQGQVADRVSQSLLPTELAQTVVDNTYEMFAKRVSFDEDRAKRVLDALRSSGLTYEIEAVDLEDQPTIELLDGNKYKASTSLSTGQRCTTILPILLVQSERPLLIDQPEDNLDNAFVYETVVNALRSVKGSRQVIFVTHNPNIPVLGEAERVFVFSSDGQLGTPLRAYDSETLDPREINVEGE